MTDSGNEDEEELKEASDTNNNKPKSASEGSADCSGVQECSSVEEDREESDGNVSLR